MSPKNKLAGIAAAAVCLIMGVLLQCSYAQQKVSPEEQEARDHYRLGNVYYQQGKYKEAQDEYQRAMDLMKRMPRETATVLEGETVPAAPARQDSIGSEYVIGDDDELKITVWQNPDLDSEVVVRPDGRISFPLIGDLIAKGQTISQLCDTITLRLSEFVRNPQINISIKKMGGSRIIILGEVGKPGIYTVTRAKTVFEAIVLAGGPSPHAVLSSVIVIRNVLTSQPQAQRLNLVKLFQNKNMSQNFVLQPEDVIFIPRRFIADVNYFVSQIIDPIAKGVFMGKEIRDW